VNAPLIYLASHSPRRRQLLEQIGVAFVPLAVAVDESRRPGEHPLAYVERLALAKARAGWAERGERAPLPVLGADTAVVLGDQVLGKPAGRGEARAMVAALAGRSHQVLSAVALVEGRRAQVCVNATTVWFAAVAPADLEAYCAGDEPLDKAGAYGIQGRAAMFISRIEGSYSGVMGLPLYETAELLEAFGIPVRRMR
jgi:septum formation protein